MSTMASLDEMMYACGLETLHPGGMAKTEEMAKACGIGPGKRLLDIGAGRGASACYLARKYGCRVTGIDTSARMIAACCRKAEKERLDDLATFVVADACDLPFEDAFFDIVIAECVTVLLDKQRAFGEMLRATKPGGCVGDLEMIWRTQPPERALNQTRELWEGYQTMTLVQWKTFFQQLGLQDVQVADFTDAVGSIDEAMKRGLGWRGTAKLTWQLLLHGDLRRAMRAYARIFRDYAHYIGYGYFVGRTPPRSEGV